MGYSLGFQLCTIEIISPIGFRIYGLKKQYMCWYFLLIFSFVIFFHWIWKFSFYCSAEFCALHGPNMCTLRTQPEAEKNWWQAGVPRNSKTLGQAPLIYTQHFGNTNKHNTQSHFFSTIKAEYKVRKTKVWNQDKVLWRQCIKRKATPSGTLYCMACNN